MLSGHPGNYTTLTDVTGNCVHPPICATKPPICTTLPFCLVAGKGWGAANFLYEAI